MEAWYPNHWTTREVPDIHLFDEEPKVKINVMSTSFGRQGCCSNPFCLTPRFTLCNTALLLILVTRSLLSLFKILFLYSAFRSWSRKWRKIPWLLYKLPTTYNSKLICLVFNLFLSDIKSYRITWYSEMWRADTYPVYVIICVFLSCYFSIFLFHKSVGSMCLFTYVAVSGS